MTFMTAAMQLTTKMTQSYSPGLPAAKLEGHNNETLNVQYERWKFADNYTTTLNLKFNTDRNEVTLIETFAWNKDNTPDTLTMRWSPSCVVPGHTAREMLDLYSWITQLTMEQYE